MYMVAGDTDGSIEQFRRTVGLDPNHGRTRLLHAILLARLGRYGESIEEFQKGEILSGTPPEQSAEHAASLRKAAASGRASDFWHGYLKLALDGIGRPGHGTAPPISLKHTRNSETKTRLSNGWRRRTGKETGSR
jgi:tetratricopeptide (TPR) repeat protein